MLIITSSTTLKVHKITILYGKNGHFNVQKIGGEKRGSSSSYHYHFFLHSPKTDVPLEEE